MDMCKDIKCIRNLGVKRLAWGLLLLLNAFVWPKWAGIDGWVAWVAVLLVLAGLRRILFPTLLSHPVKEVVRKKKR